MQNLRHWQELQNSQAWQELSRTLRDANKDQTTNLVFRGDSHSGELLEKIHYARGLQYVFSYVDNKVKQLNDAAKELESLT